MAFSIPRGIIYHSITEDLKWLWQAFYCRLDDNNVIESFEKSFAALVERKHCTAFPFARTAIYFALKHKNFPQGTEILMPPITIKGILDAVLDLGLKPVFVDINPETLCFDANALQRAITEKTKAILLTYLFGIVPDMNELMAIAKANKLFVIEDFSQCLNGTFDGKPVGSFGDVGVYSASSIKTLDTYGGGLLVCDDIDTWQAMSAAQANLQPATRGTLINKILTDLIRNLATNRVIFTAVVFWLLKLLNRVSQDSLVKQTGDRDKCMIKHLPQAWFTAFTSLQARAGLTLISRVKQQDERRVSNVEQLKTKISPLAVQFPRGVTKGKNVYWQLIGYISDTSNVQRRLYPYGVDTARSSLLQISSLTDYPCHAVMANASRLYETGFFVPAYPDLSAADIDRIANAFNSLATPSSV